MATHRAECQDCGEEYTDPDLLKVSDWAEDHERKEMHDVSIERAVATDGGFDHVLVSRFKTRGVYHDPDPENPDQPNCQCADSATRKWQRRSVETLSDRFTYCQYCDPEKDPAPRNNDGGELATRLRAMTTEEFDDQVATDGGADRPKPIKWSFHAVVHGADVDADCLALTGTGKPCSYNAYDSNDDPVCNTHARSDDPEIVDDGHQWARISDDAVITVCVNCELVVDGKEPETAVACPECSAEVGQRCKDETSTYAAPIPPHPKRRRRAYDALGWFTPCEDNPAGDVDEDQEVLTDGGQQTISIPVYAHVAGDGGVHCSYGARILTVDTLTPPEDTSFATVEWIEGKFHRQDWADEVVERIVPEPRRESLGVDKCRVGTLTADPAAGAIINLVFEEPDDIPGPDLSADGGHVPGAATASPAGPRDDAFAGDELHKCDLCGQVFDELEDLRDHDCRPPDELLVDGGGGRDV